MPFLEWIQHMKRAHTKPMLGTVSPSVFIQSHSHATAHHSCGLQYDSIISVNLIISWTVNWWSWIFQQVWFLWCFFFLTHPCLWTQEWKLIAPSLQYAKLCSSPRQAKAYVLSSQSRVPWHYCYAFFFLLQNTPFTSAGCLAYFFNVWSQHLIAAAEFSVTFRDR